MTYSILKCVAVCGILSLALTGCAADQTTAHDPVQHNPQPDQATAHRNFPRSTCHYANGDVEAWPNCRIDTPTWGDDPQTQDYSSLVLELPVFGVQSVGTPLWMLFQPPWTTVVSHDGSNYPPAFTVAPPK